MNFIKRFTVRVRFIVLVGVIFGQININAGLFSLLFGEKNSHKLSNKIAGKSSVKSFANNKNNNGYKNNNGSSIGKICLWSIIGIGIFTGLVAILNLVGSDNGKDNVNQAKNISLTNQGQNNNSSNNINSGNINSGKTNFIDQDMVSVDKGVDRFLEVAREKNILKGSCEYKVTLNSNGISNGQKKEDMVINNHIYQLSVDYQGSVDEKRYSGSASCGPRALYNAIILSEIFDNNGTISESKINNKIGDLNSIGDLPENPRLREFFSLILESWQRRVLGERYFFNHEDVLSVPVMEKDEKTGKFVVKKIMNESGKLVTQRENVNNLKAGFIDPVNLDDGMLIDLTNYFSQSNNRPFVAKNIKVALGYKEAFYPVYHDALIEPINDKLPGYTVGYVISKGQVERGADIHPSSGSHWISLFVIKISNTEYNWFIMDSLNSNYINGCDEYKQRILGYISKLEGSVNKNYEDIVASLEVEMNAAMEKEKFNSIENKLKIIEILNKDRKSKDSDFRLNNNMKIDTGFKDCKMTKQILYNFLDQQIIDINGRKKFDSDEIVNPGLRLIDPKEKEALVKRITDLKDSEMLKFDDNFDKFVIEQDGITGQDLYEKENEYVEYLELEKLINKLTEINQENKDKFVITGSCDLGVKRMLDAKPDYKVKKEDIKKWLDAKKNKLDDFYFLENNKKALVKNKFDDIEKALEKKPLWYEIK